MQYNIYRYICILYYFYYIIYIYKTHVPVANRDQKKGVGYLRPRAIDSYEPLFGYC